MTPEELVDALKNAKQTSVVHQSLTVKAELFELLKTSAVEVPFYNSKYVLIVPPYKYLSRVINPNEK